MRSSIEMNDALLREALKATGLTTKRAVVEGGLRLLLKVKVKGQEGIRRLRGKVAIDGYAYDTEIGGQMR
jgi:Arc/MetJ family transcription regulator